MFNLSLGRTFVVFGALGLMHITSDQSRLPSHTSVRPRAPIRAARLAASVILMVAILTAIALPVAALENVPGVVMVA